MLEIEILGEDGARTAGKVERRLHGKAGLLPTAEAALVYGWRALSGTEKGLHNLAMPSTSTATRLLETNSKPEHASLSLLLASSRCKISLSLFHSSNPSGGTSMAQSVRRELSDIRLGLTPWRGTPSHPAVYLLMQPEPKSNSHPAPPAKENPRLAAAGH